MKFRFVRFRNMRENLIENSVVSRDEIGNPSDFLGDVRSRESYELRTYKFKVGEDYNRELRRRDFKKV